MDTDELSERLTDALASGDQDYLRRLVSVRLILDDYEVSDLLITAFTITPAGIELTVEAATERYSE